MLLPADHPRGSEHSAMLLPATAANMIRILFGSTYTSRLVLGRVCTSWECPGHFSGCAHACKHRRVHTGAFFLGRSTCTSPLFCIVIFFLSQMLPVNSCLLQRIFCHASNLVCLCLVYLLPPVYNRCFCHTLSYACAISNLCLLKSNVIGYFAHTFIVTRAPCAHSLRLHWWLSRVHRVPYHELVVSTSVWPRTAPFVASDGCEHEA